MSRPCFRVLLIEDNPGDADLMRKALASADFDCELTVVPTLAGGLAAIADEAWDIVLSDLSLPDSQGLDAIAALRRAARLTPIVVLTSLDNDEIALQSLDEGAQDYLVKDRVTGEVLERAIRYAIQRQKNAEMIRLVEELRRSERLLERKNRRLARLYKTAHRFVDNVSHEFRTPLTVIMEYVSLLRDGVVGRLGDEQNHMLDVVSDRAGDLNNMVNDMLDISKLEAGMLGIWRRNCRVQDAMSHVTSSLSKKSDVKSIDLRFEISEDLPQVYCDDEKLGRVIINLATNAIKFCGQPGLVRIWARRDDQNREVTVGVTDNGPGISEENLNSIFERFKQVGGNPRGSTKGFGLGLNIAKELVQLNLGEISVQSICGQGSTFWFTVPYAQPKEVIRRYADRIALAYSGASAVSLLKASVEETVDDDLAEDCQCFLNTLLRRNDLLFSISRRQWLLALPEERTELNKFFQRLEAARRTANRNRPNETLPEFELEVLGTWPVPQRLDPLFSAVDELFHSQEATVG
jgi:signal transduction histidine kinase